MKQQLSRMRNPNYSITTDNVSTISCYYSVDDTSHANNWKIVIWCNNYKVSRCQDDEFKLRVKTQQPTALDCVTFYLEKPTKEWIRLDVLNNNGIFFKIQSMLWKPWNNGTLLPIWFSVTENEGNKDHNHLLSYYVNSKAGTI